MPASQKHISSHTPLGANLVTNGVTFRTWAPAATGVYISGSFNNWTKKVAKNLLVRDDNGYWSGFVAGAKEFDEYKFYIVGTGSEGYKRDPYARELTRNWPDSNCIIRSPEFDWRDADFRTPPFHKLIIYQLHVGTFSTRKSPLRGGTFLDVVLKIEYLKKLGINCLQLLPIQEFMTQFSMGYNGTDYYSPEMDFAIEDKALAPYLTKVNRLLAQKDQAPVGAKAIQGSLNQLKLLINLCHLYGLAVILDVVYNHAGGAFDDASIFYYDRQPGGDDNRSLYFTERGHAGGKVFAMWKREVRQFLIDNAKMFLTEYHVDGFRYDQVSVLVQENGEPGWRFCQDLNKTNHFLKPEAFSKAEYWSVDPYIVRPVSQGGAGFDAILHDGLRDSIRGIVDAASIPGDHGLDMDRLAHSMRDERISDNWRTVQCIENHDEVFRGRGQRIPSLADKSNARSEWAAARSRVALGLLMTAPGIPMIFMGQEFLEYKQWADDLDWHSDLLISWKDLKKGVAVMTDFLAFSSDLIWLRRNAGALTGVGYQPIHVNNAGRVFAFQRWSYESTDLLVVMSFNNSTFDNYTLGVPHGGEWKEIFNSDYYCDFPNPHTQGNGGSLHAYGPPVHGMPHSANLLIPANSILVFEK